LLTFVKAQNNTAHAREFAGICT